VRIVGAEHKSLDVLEALSRTFSDMDNDDMDSEEDEVRFAVGEMDD
jgi:hypothetical protein